MAVHRSGGQTLRIERLPHFPKHTDLGYQHSTDAGFDLVVATQRAVEIFPGDAKVIPTGIKVLLPPGTEMQLRPRSGLAAKHGLTIINSPGTIDAGFTGEIHVPLYKLNTPEFHQKVQFKPGDRICQAVIAPVIQPAIAYGSITADSERGEAGFGSTGCN